MTPEGKLKKDIKEYLDKAGFWRAGAAQPARVVGWYYMPVSNGMGVVGIPDFVGIYRGTPFLIETKVGKKEPTANQLARHTEIKAAGGYCFVCRSVSDVEAAILHVNEAIDG